MSREPINMTVSDHVYVKKTLRLMHGGLDPVAQILLFSEKTPHMWRMDIDIRVLTPRGRCYRVDATW